MTSTIEHIVQFLPYSQQAEFLNSRVQFKTLVAGRRSGKTAVGTADMITHGIESPCTQSLILAPTYLLSREHWLYFMELCPPALLGHINRSERIITLTNEHEIHFRSGDRPENLRGIGWSRAWLDETDSLRESLWYEVVRPALLDSKGGASFTGTPKGKRMLFRFYALGQDNKEPDWASWNYPTSASPYIDLKELEKMKRQMPELTFRQEMMAEFLDDLGNIFRGVDKCVTGEFEPPQPGKMYFMGIDLAKHYDFTVIVIMDELGHIVYLDRFNQLDWDVQIDRIVDAWRKYNQALPFIDATGVGDPVFDRMRKIVTNLKPFKFDSHGKKVQLIDAYSLAIQNLETSYPKEAVELINELKLFGFINKAGNLEYSAPDGYHDDTVIGAALAHHARTGGPKVTSIDFFGKGNLNKPNTNILSRRLR